MPKPFTVVFYDEGAHGTTQLGGGQLARLSLAQALSMDRFDPIILTSVEGELAAEARARNLRTIVYPIVKYPNRVVRSQMLARPFQTCRTLLEVPSSGKRLADVLKSLNAHLVHPNENFSRLVTIASRRWNRIPAVTHVDNEWNTGIVDGLMGRLFTRNFDRLIAVSKATKRMTVRFVSDPDRVIYIPEGVDPRSFRNLDRTKLRRELDLPESMLIIGTVGKLTNAKGQQIMLRSLAKLNEELPDYRYCLIGDGPARGDLEQLTATLELDEHVVFLGQRWDVPQLLAGIDLIVHPSLTEASPLTLVESLFAARPVIASDVGGVSEILGDGRFGWLIPARSIDHLRGALREAISMSEEARWRLGSTAREYALKHYSLDKTVQETESLYLELLGARA